MDFGDAFFEGVAGVGAGGVGVVSHVCGDVRVVCADGRLAQDEGC